MKNSLFFSALVYVSMVHFNLHQRPHYHSAKEAPVSWLQQKENDATQVEHSQSPLNHTEIEKIVWNFNLNNAGDVILDFETTDLLELAVRHIPADIQTAQLQRISFLIEKSLPGIHGKQLAQLIHSYYLYQQEYDASLRAIDQAKGGNKLSLLRASRRENEQRQKRLFGSKAATKLFARKNLNTNYFNERRLITMDGSLNPEQNRERLAALQENYRLALKKYLPLPAKN